MSAGAPKGAFQEVKAEIEDLLISSLRLYTTPLLLHSVGKNKSQSQRGSRGRNRITFQWKARQRIHVHLHCTMICAQSLQLSPTLCDPMDYRPPGSSVHRILQARILECVAMASSGDLPDSGGQTHVSCASCIGRQILYHYKAPPETPGNI